MMWVMLRSTKLGMVSLLLLFGWLLPSPIGAACAVISGVLGLLAAQQGSKWWFVVPVTITVLTAGLMFIGFRAK
jgi:hypothetical protein